MRGPQGIFIGMKYIYKVWKMVETADGVRATFFTSRGEGLFPGVTGRCQSTFDPAPSITNNGKLRDSGVRRRTPWYEKSDVRRSRERNEEDDTITAAKRKPRDLGFHSGIQLEIEAEIASNPSLPNG